MNEISRILDENQGNAVALFLKGGMYVDGKIVETTNDSVTLEVNINAQRQAFSGGSDLKNQTLIHSTISKEEIFRLDRIAIKGH
jgi:hypothetical protein